jgi:hypothetical protein
MDQIRKIIREELSNMGRDIVITIPKSISWEDYQKEIDAVKDGSQVMNFKVNHFPKTKPGNKCYLVHNGFVKGWMEIVGLSEDNFTCTTTGRKWQGKFIQRSGPFHEIEPKLMKGFQGFRYF